MYMKLSYLPLILSFVILALLTPFMNTIDLQITRHYYTEGVGFTPSPFILFIYTYGPWVAFTTFLATIGVFIAGFLFTPWKRWQKGALILMVSYVVGAGFITHVIFKDHWGRPRPKQVTEFGGKQAFRPYYSPNFFHQPEHSKSFPCGHCATGFYFIALSVAAIRWKSNFLFWLGIALAAVLGGLLSYARIVQGGHFFSDTLVSAMIMCLVPYYCSRWLPEESAFHSSSK